MGIDPGVGRGALAVRLLRPVAVLCALHLYRFGFAVGTLVVTLKALSSSHVTLRAVSSSHVIHQALILSHVTLQALILSHVTLQLNQYISHVRSCAVYYLCTSLV